MDKLDEIITFCLDHGICAVAVRANLARPSQIRKLKNAGLYILCYTVTKDADYAKKLLDSGVDTICTDEVTPSQLAKSENSFGKVPFSVYYNSGIAISEEQYSARIADGTLDGILQTFDSGNTEFRDQTVWPNDGKKTLVPNLFHAKDRTFVGWKLRIGLDGKRLWYCNDHCYHTAGDLRGDTDLKEVIFPDEAALPVWTFKKNTRLIMVAVWKSVS
jgi:hypothetical protein